MTTTAVTINTESAAQNPGKITLHYTAMRGADAMLEIMFPVAPPPLPTNMN